jgi:tetratricopeptide (TPR) repeat protein
MSLIRSVLLGLVCAGLALAQVAGLTLPPSGNNQRASVTQFIGPVQVSIEYSGPKVHGPDGKDRRGQIWGKLVPYGFDKNNSFGNGKPMPWRAGANENTVFAISDDVLIEGKPLPAGRYGLHMIPGQDEWTLIFSKNANAWGSFFYEEAEDALRVAVKPHKHEYREWLTYEFPVRKPSEATVELQWEDLAIGWNIKVEDPDKIYITRLRHDLTGANGFNWQAYDTAAQWTAMSGKYLEDGLRWAEIASSKPLIGQENFQTLSTKARILDKLGRADEAQKTIDIALRLPGTTATDIHMYGRQLMAEKKYEQAYRVFRLNGEKNGDMWPVHVGLARAYSGSGDLKQALEHAKKALEQAPDPLNRVSLEAMVKTLSEGKPIAQ